MIKINTIIFDLGRVLVNISTSGEKFGALMRSMGVEPAKAMEQYWHARELRQFMTGEMDSKTFYETVRGRFGIAVDFDGFAEAWTDLFSPKPEMRELFETMAARYNMGILSDTDPLHWAKLKSLMPWLEAVRTPTLSHEVGYLKPHPKMFVDAAKNVDRKPEECLFIDDCVANVDGARYCGMPALLFTGAEKLKKDLATLRVL